MSNNSTNSKNIVKNVPVYDAGAPYRTQQPVYLPVTVNKNA